MVAKHSGLQHVGVIMDGNRRWAEKRGLAPIDGHKAGYETLLRLLPAAQQLAIPYLTIFAFSTENWERADEEVQGIMKLLKWVIRHKLKTFVDGNIRLRLIGARESLPGNIRDAIESAEKATAACDGITLGICFNYGGQQEIVDAVQAIIDSNNRTNTVDLATVTAHIYAPDIPPLDMVVRTSGEQRLSGFMLWRAAYAELYFTDVLWPDFDEAQLYQAVEEYEKRTRRFGR